MTRSYLSSITRLSWLVGATVAIAACGDGGVSTTGSGGTGGTSSSGGSGGSGAVGGGGTGGTTSTGGSGGSGGATTTTTPTDDFCPPDPSGPVPALKLTKLVSGLDLPLYLTSPPGDTSRLFVLEQKGRIRIIKDGVLIPEPFLDIDGLVQNVEFAGDERGLIGLAFHPKFAENGRFFVHYTDDASNHGTIVEYHAAPASDIADDAPVKTIFTVSNTQYGNHNGGMLAFGPDGYLYMGFGDGGQGGDPDENGQNLLSELGKIHRIDPDIYPVPVAGNLVGGYPHAWDYGLRNPWRFSFDRCNGDLYIGDVGQGAWEEVDVEPKGQGQNNYGWDNMEGSHCYEPANGCDMSGLTMPVAEYAHADGSGCSVTGGYVYRGTKIPNLVGTYLYGDFCSKKVWTFKYENGAATGATQLTNDLQTASLQTIVSFGEDAAGELYVIDQAGDIYKIEAE